jgi:hypothetical protein
MIIMHMGYICSFSWVRRSLLVGTFIGHEEVLRLGIVVLWKNYRSKFSTKYFTI